MDEKIVEAYIELLRSELQVARGCTEPVAIAFAAAKAREVLGEFPHRCLAECSGNIIKNVKSVKIPGTLGLFGIEAAVVAGLVSGRPEKGMELLAELSPPQSVEIRRHWESRICEVKPLESDDQLHIRVTLWANGASASVEVKGTHTNIQKIVKNSRVIFQQDESDSPTRAKGLENGLLSMARILDFVETVDLARVRELLDRQIACNFAIAAEGVLGENSSTGTGEISDRSAAASLPKYGVGIGKVLLESSPSPDILLRMKAYTAAASEARMSGCEMPVVINSGSGNQGIAASVPVIVFSRSIDCSSEKLHRALLLSNLLTIQQKSLIGRLSAFCGVVSATCAAGAAITYLSGGSREQIQMTLSNCMANTPGIICDGAKPSCGAKIVACLDAAYTAHLLAMKSRAYCAGEGIIKTRIDDTISSVAKVAREGMRETDSCILEVMLEC